MNPLKKIWDKILQTLNISYRAGDIQKEVQKEFQLFAPVNCRCHIQYKEENNMKLHFEKNHFKDQFGKRYNTEDETDMKILCQEINEEIALYNYKIKTLENKLEAIQDILGDNV